MLGKNTAQMALNFGADDVDGTIDDSTKIYSMAGSEETSPSMTVSEMIEFISSAGFSPVERDSLYNEI
jgi:aminodeoxyfutalosine synthase